jgi:hypothetical protein
VKFLLPNRSGVIAGQPRAGSTSETTRKKDVPELKCLDIMPFL